MEFLDGTGVGEGGVDLDVGVSGQVERKPVTLTVLVDRQQARGERQGNRLRLGDHVVGLGPVLR